MKRHPDLHAAVVRAVAQARVARRSSNVYDLLGALIETSEVHLMIHQTGGDAGVLASALSSAAAAVADSRQAGRFWLRLAPDRLYGRVMALAAARTSGSRQEVGPADVFAAAFDAGDPALVTVLERAGLSRVRVLQWLSGDPDGQGPPPEPNVPGVHGGVLAGLARHLMWRGLPHDDASSSDAVIAACGMLALAIWLAYDRYSAGASALWHPGGFAGVSWYAVGLLALAWLLHRVSGARAGFRRVLAPIVGWVPLALAMTLALHAWAPAAAHRPFVLLLAGSGLLHAGRILAGIGASRPRVAIVAAAGFIALFAWGTKQAFISPKLWYAVTGDGAFGEWTDSERLLFEQSDRVDAAAALVRPSDPDRPSVFFVGFAGTGEQKVFAEETKLAGRVISERYGAAGRTLLLVNDRRDRESLPLATVHGLRRALGRLAERMDLSKDVLFLFLTSHGSAEPSLAVSNTVWPLEQLDPVGLREALDASGIRWRVVVIAACYSGAFIPALADDQTAIFTSSAADRTSFGCSDDRDGTEFGDAFIRDAVPRAPSLVAAFDRAKVALAGEEQRRNLTESLPQSRIGAAFSAHWDRIEVQHAPAAVKEP